MELWLFEPAINRQMHHARHLVEAFSITRLTRFGLVAPVAPSFFVRKEKQNEQQHQPRAEPNPTLGGTLYQNQLEMDTAIRNGCSLSMFSFVLACSVSLRSLRSRFPLLIK